MLKELEDGDWSEAFNYANPERALPNDLDVSLDSFDREDVASIIAMDEGENDGNDWLIVGRLKDGRYFSLSAGCDYTGWG